jgi:type II secretory pathway component GspD/PulD (secretin)
MKYLLATLLLAGAIMSNASAAKCKPGELSFNFSKLPVREAFAIFADCAGLKPRIDPSIRGAEAMYFVCTNWRVAAKALARQQHLSLEIKHGVMYVRKQ